MSSTPSRSGWPPTSLWSGRRGRLTESKFFSAPPRPLKAATAFCRKCITISGAYPSSVTRCGRSCIISIVKRQMVRHQRRGFSSGRSRIFLRRCYPISQSCLGLDNEKMRECYVTDIMECPALRGYPKRNTTRCSAMTRNLLIRSSQRCRSAQPEKRKPSAGYWIFTSAVPRMSLAHKRITVAFPPHRRHTPCTATS